MAEAPPAALWLVDKPAGPTSHDVVAGVRRRLGRKVKVGHTGTLDPFATGLLVLMVARATRLAPLLTGLDKTYLATLRTGFTSESGDPEGPIARAGEPAGGEASPRSLPAFVGVQRQRVPALSRGEGRRGAALRADPPGRGDGAARARDRGARPAHGGGPRRRRGGAGGALQRRHLRPPPGVRHRRAPGLRRLPHRAAADGGGEHVGGRRGAAGRGGPRGRDRPAGGAAAPAARGELDADGALEVAHGRWRGDAAAATGPVALVRDGRLVAVARPDGEGVLRAGLVLEDPR